MGLGGVTETYRSRLANPPPTAKDKQFAVKLLRADRGGTEPPVVQAFVAAARRLAGPTLPGVARVVELSPGPEEVFCVSELIAGTDLEKVRSKGAMDPLAIGRLGAQIADRLATLHNSKPRPIIHGGISPGNVLVTPAGEIALLDCGLSSAIRQLTENPIEKWLFVAPELLLGDDPTVASDLFAIGAVLFFLATGRPPYVAETRDDLAAHAMKGPPPMPGVAPWLAQIVRGLLSPAPPNRPATAAALSQDLKTGAKPKATTSMGMAPPLATQATPAPVRAAAKAPPVARTAPPVAPVGEEHDDGTEAVVVRGADRPRSGAPEQLQTVFRAPIMPAQRSVNPDDPSVGVVYDEEEQEGATGAGGSGAAARPALVVNVPRPPQQGQSGLQAMIVGAVLIAIGAVTGGMWAGRGRPPAADQKGGQTGTTTALKPNTTPPLPGMKPGQVRLVTKPPGAAVWIDGAEHVGKTPITIETMPGGHRLLLVQAGFRMLRDTIDTSVGSVVEREMVPIDWGFDGPVILTVQCQTAGKFPVFLDGKETGLLCPVAGLKIRPGTHMVGVFVIPQNKLWSFERDVAPTPPSHRVIFSY